MTQHPNPLTRPAALISAALCLFACTGSIPLPSTGPSTGSDGQIQVLRLAEGKSPPAQSGRCWASDIAPAVIETVTKQVQIRPERRDTAGQIIQAARFETQTAQRIVNDRATIWFQAPCPAELTPAFVASLQRALKARGWYAAPVTGQSDPPTTEALRRYQRSLGLDSGQLSTAAAQGLGLLAADL